MHNHETTYRVTYGDTDQMGYMYYGHYARLYEIGRAEMLRSSGLTYQQFEQELRIMMPVMHLECKYLRPALYDQLLTIETTLADMPTKMITFQHRILSERGELLNKGQVKLFFIDMKTLKRISSPDVLTHKLKRYFG